VPRHGRDVVREENAAFLRCPSENVRIRSASATCLSDPHDVHVWKTRRASNRARIPSGGKRTSRSALISAPTRAASPLATA
jgi:hypothetical protein